VFPAVISLKVFRQPGL